MKFKPTPQSPPEKEEFVSEDKKWYLTIYRYRGERVRFAIHTPLIHIFQCEKTKSEAMKKCKAQIQNEIKNLTGRLSALDEMIDETEAEEQNNNEGEK